MLKPTTKFLNFSMISLSRWSRQLKAVGWGTSGSSGVPVVYEPGDLITLNADITLYGVWKSVQPTVDIIAEADAIIGGTGVLYGVSASGSFITEEIMKIGEGFCSRMG